MKSPVPYFVIEKILRPSFLARSQYQTTPPHFFKRIANQVRLERRFSSSHCIDIEKLLTQPEVQKFIQLLTHEHRHSPASNNSLSLLLDKITDIESNIRFLKDLSHENDKEIQSLVQTEKEEYLREIKNLHHELILQTLPMDADEGKSVTLEVSQGLGGTEARLFTKELFHMYLKYTKFNNWELSELKAVEEDGGGYQKASVFISGQSVYKYLRHEAGIHRVQRIPITEKGGKMQTSTCRVHVLPDLGDTEINIRESDLVIETKSSSAPGGQNVNKTETCVRILHKPTGIVVESQKDRYQYLNKLNALQKLKNVLYQQEIEKKQAEIKCVKSEQGTSIKRSDKIRTYHFTQNRVTDHRLNHTVSDVWKFMEGNHLLHSMMVLMEEHYQLIYAMKNIMDIVKGNKISEVLHSRNNL